MTPVSGSYLLARARPNEFGHREGDVWDFSASRYLVSNREFLWFVEDRGYEQEELWTSEG